MKLCINCKHFKDENKVLLTHWAKMLCTNPKVQSIPTLDPVTGKKAFIGVHPSLQGVISGAEYPYANRVNIKGDCSLFVEGKE